MPNTVNSSAYGPIHGTTIAKGDIVLNAAANAGHKVVRIYGYNSTPDHVNCKCLDFMHYGDTAMRLWLENYLEQNADNLGVAGIISERRVMGFPENDGGSYRGPRGQWRPYSGPNPHTDHVHVQFDQSSANAPAKPAPSDPASPASPSGYPTPIDNVVYQSKIQPGQKDSDSVWWVQKALNSIRFTGGVTLTLDGYYGPSTAAEVRKFQTQVCHDTPDGALGPIETPLLFRTAKLSITLKGN